MDAMTPLQIVSETIAQMFRVKNTISEEQQSFDCVFEEPIGKRSISMDVEWYQSGMELLVGMCADYDLGPCKKHPEIMFLVEDAVEPFREGHFELPSDASELFSLTEREDGKQVPCYQFLVGYEPLEDEEIRLVFEAGLRRGIRTLQMLSPLFVCLEHGFLPDPLERLDYLKKLHGFCEVHMSASDAPSRSVCLPPGLFGGIETLRAQ